MCIRLNSHSFIKRIHNQRIVIVVTNLIGHNPTIIEIQNGAQVYLMDFDADVILELCYIGQPLLIRCICMEVTIQIVPGDVCRIIATSGAALRFPLDRGLDVLLTADPQDTLIVHSDTMPFVQFISDPSVSHFRISFMDVLDLLCDFFVVPLTETDRILQPAIVSTAREMQVLTKSLHGIALFFRQFFDRLILV